MIQTLPHSTLLRYVYNELPANEQHDVEDALQHAPELAEACAEILLAKQMLDRLARGPRPNTTATILQYSQTFPK